MKYLTIIIMLLSNIDLLGQVRSFNNIPKEVLEQLDKMGSDSSPFLNTYESEYFNIIFKDSLNDFDFTNKKIGFLKANIKQNKKIYFKEEKERFQNNSTIISSYLYIFDINSKKESGGYDAAVIYWSKFTIPIDKIVKILRENN